MLVIEMLINISATYCIIITGKPHFPDKPFIDIPQFLRDVEPLPLDLTRRFPQLDYHRA